MHLRIRQSAALPELAWALRVRRADSIADLICGNAVEIDEAGIIAGIWSAPFSNRAVADATSFAGTAIRKDRDPDRLVALCGNASPTPLHIHRTGSQLVISNALALGLACGEDGLRPSYAFYPQELYLDFAGPHRRHDGLRTAKGTLQVAYHSVELDRALRLQRLVPPPVPAFDGYRAYRSLLVSELRAMFANAADPGRRIRYRPIVALSKGYDSPAAAVLAAEAGCREAMTYRQCIEMGDDSGEEIARQLGLSVTAFETFAYKNRTDLPEIEFIAASFSGGQVYLAGSEQVLSQTIVVGGGGGDVVWDRAYGENAANQDPNAPLHLSGYGSIDFFLRLPAIEVAVPAIAASRSAEIGAIARSPETAPWSVGLEYDRPLARRIVEEAGIARGTFAQEKRRAAPPYDSVSRRAPGLDLFLSPHSLSEFERWFSVRRPLRPAAALAHKLATDTIGRILWSKKTARALAKASLPWPPFAHRIRHLRFPKRKNAFLFTWAVERQISAYREALGRKAPPLLLP